ncbi:hypothetical protein Rhe02_58320 [Rhizocola hellebori]|uniref:DUF6603 domain-containing protein n=1 Tax=Rhizocola hellebori TaxID=1392758 RepID=A0A8J3VIM8_9ACTN|nr:DUF6603 domain-containing protein [Rhizocola hellebori]GIH07765.1 hypothetical protein Rhe02_58320 [Rhizocola hellebori]
MSQTQGTLHALAVHLVRAVQPLANAFSDSESFKQLMFQLGWEVDGLPPQYSAVADKVAAAADAISAMPAQPQASDLLAVIGKVGDVYRAVAGLTEAPQGVDAQAFLGEIGRRLFEFVLAEDLRLWAPRMYGTLHALGVIAYEYVPSANGRPDHTRLRFDWDQIPAILSDPSLIPERLYGWGTTDFAFGRLATALMPLLHGIGVPVSLDLIGEQLSTALQTGALAPPAGPVRYAITLPLFDLPINGRYEQVGFMLAGLPAEGDAPPGMILQIMAPNGLAETVDLGDGWKFALRAGTDLANQLGVVIRPGETFARYPFASGQPLPSAGLGLSLRYQADAPTLLFGQPGKTRLELAAGEIRLGVIEKAGEVEVTAGAVVDGLTFVLSTADLDGFLGSALGGQEMRVPLQLGVTWSSRTGLDFIAGAGFTVSIYPHLDLGVLRFDRVDLAVKLTSGPGTPELGIAALLSFSGVIGPVSYAVDRVGVQLAATFADGDAGPAGIDLTPVWPTGLGLGIDAGPVRGGGFISYDKASGRYVGILQLEVYDIGVSAIGVLDTKDAAGAPLPSPGYSFVLLVFADIPHIQLGYGFTLNAVGGIAALNRRLDTTALLAGIRQGGVDRILFPTDPVRDANTIVTALTAIFPIAMGRYVFGPAAIIGWGTPTLITFELAIVVEVPAPVTVALLGTARALLPNESAPIVELHVDIVGIFEPAKKTIAVDASLHDSKVAGFAVSGDLAMRLNYGSDPDFALAVGGFNPHFTPPPGFPALRRITVALGAGDNPRVTLEGYLAVTANSRQFGAKAELYAARGGFNVHGWVSFDTLIVLHPFGFRFDFSAGVTLNRGSRRIAGVTVEGTLTGPNPFHVWGKASLSLLFFDISVPFDATFGLDWLVPELAATDPWGLLAQALALPDNWAVDAVRRGVSFVGTGAAGRLLDPGSAATLRQKVLPLARNLELFGQYEISGPASFTVTAVAIGTRPADFVPVNDFFTPGDFEKLSETDQLSRDSFELMQAGVRVDAGPVAPEAATKVASLEYQTKIIDSSWRVRSLPPVTIDRGIQLAAVRASSATQARFARRDGRTGGVKLAPETYTVATTDTLGARPDIATAMTRGAALAALRGSGTAGLQVVPTYETETSG